MGKKKVYFIIREIFKWPRFSLFLKNVKTTIKIKVSAVGGNATNCFL